MYQGATNKPCGYFIQCDAICHSGLGNELYHRKNVKKIVLSDTCSVFPYSGVCEVITSFVLVINSHTKGGTFSWLLSQQVNPVYSN